jgi:large subunit ribosomal protein L13
MAFFQHVFPKLRPGHVKNATQTMHRTWHLYDADKQRVGRLAQRVACLLQGKHKPNFKPGLDLGDTVVVINCEKVVFTGRKEKRKLYRKHTTYPGGLKELTAEQVRARDPQKLLQHAVRGMLPRNKMRQPRMSRLKCYEGPDHPHAAQFGLKVSPPAPDVHPKWEDVVPDDPQYKALYDYWTKVRGQADEPW